MAPKVSIIIASHRPALISGLLDGILRQQFDGVYEILVVTDYSPEELKKKYPRAQWHYLENRSISAKRNLGVSKSIGEITAFIDDDCVPMTDWLQNGTLYLDEHKETAAVEGLTTIEETGLLTGTHREYRRLEKPGYRTNNIFYRKKVFLDAGGFDERFTVQREDVDLAFSVIKTGGKIDYNPGIRVEHRFRHWEKWDLLKNCWNRRFDPLLFRKHPELYRKHIRSPFPPAIAGLLCSYFLCLSLFPVRSLSRWAASLVLALILGLGIKRTGFKKVNPERFLFDTISVALAPLVLTAALVYGGIRFRKLLIY
ncbi:MAG: glycosyltransferase [Fibrobacter sp.]|nr:glycosyltransferase [Fibrobacter sp.]